MKPELFYLLIPGILNQVMKIKINMKELREVDKRVK